MGGGECFCAAEMTNDNAVSGDGETHDNVLPPEKTVVVDGDHRSAQPLTPPPLLSSYNDMKHKMRPLFDAVHTLRCMNVVKEGDEGIILQPIVVIGDHSSGKSSLIESLAGIDLPRISTRVPLIMRFQHHSDPVSELRLEYNEKSVPVNETNVSAWISRLTESLAGKGKEISNVPLTLVVKKNNVPDLTIIDLPGVPVNGQSEMIPDILETYIKLEDCIILHVISATTAAFTACESIKILDKFDKTGDRTLHVCTKVDEASEDMVTTVSTNYMGPDYVCVRNRFGDETHEQARAKEASLFETHHLLSKLHKSMIGVPVLVQKLLQIQVDVVSNRLCKLVEVINKDLNKCVFEDNRLQKQQNFTTVLEAMPAFVQIIDNSQKSLGKLLCNVFDEFPNETSMDCKTRLREMRDEFSQQLKNNQDEEFVVLEERKWSLEQAIHYLFERKIADMSTIISMFASRVWDYIGFVLVKLLELHAQNSYPQLLLSLKIAGKKLIASHKESFKGRLLELLDMEKTRDYICDVGVIYSWNDLKKKIIVCLEMVRNNIFDSEDLNLQSMIFTNVAVEMGTQMVNELNSGGENRYRPMLKESRSTTTRTWKLKNRIEMLQKLKKVVENTMDEIFFHNL